MTLTTLLNANVLDVDNGTIVPDQKIVIEDGIICEISPSTAGVKSGRSIDLSGATLMPGLIDAHVHVTAYTTFGELAQAAPSYASAQAARLMKKMLMRGFTTVRDVGGADFGLSNAVAEGLFEGPRLLFGGKALSQTGGHGDFRAAGVDAYDPSYWQPGLGCIVDGITEVRRAVRHEVRRGANHIKFMGGGGAASPTDRLDSDQFSEEEIAAIVEEAAMANLYVVVHAYATRTIERAARLGVRSIEHGNYLDEPTAALLRERNTFLVPTIVTCQAAIRYGAEAGLSSSSIAKEKALIEPAFRAIELARNAGIPMAYGTDLVGNMMQELQLQEFSIRREVVPSSELLKSATIVGAELVKMENQIGRVANGYFADLIAIKGNPLNDISIMENPEHNLMLVMKGGAIHKNEL
ncbi:MULTISPECIES: amidohydrolase family protein [unclassified Mesorhizobium]|uniref:metal-dependent hydrolase family protein n=1 Tax=unclassified Mesorhizobium TaxID=325217 RepID=UPI0010931EDD|nr:MULTISPECIES: amidohydrolase family protein [unclassified Mesorhizobium]TGS43771.1 amidohydrolase family protein [Mesorhizobium sp. M8A.F.Ca.ET.182.01.1.1]TGS78352.1 amidohydrolase family protein [Mesorhizobium sp. M8A.F.Ca.ET.181.01.1.1]TGV15489.1 amidohydrolase family protein [Mesorhizobium sp. M8A.F.Ca.ET.173.01.1.1]